MSLDPKARKYAAVLFGVSEQTDAKKDVLESLSLVRRLMKDNPQFRAFLHSKRLNGEQKAEILSGALGDKVHPVLTQFLGLTKGENLVKLLQDIEKAYKVLYAEAMNLVSVTAHVPSPLDEAEIMAIKTALEEAFEKTMELSVEVNPNLIGGIKLRIGNKFLDASIQNQMETMRRQLLEA